MEFLGLKVPSLLDSGSMVTLIREAYFNKNILPLLHVQWRIAEGHSLFRLSATNNQDCQSRGISRLMFLYLGFGFPSVGFLVVKDPNIVLESQYSARTPGVIGCNLIWLGYEEFGKVYGFWSFWNLHVRKRGPSFDFCPDVYSVSSGQGPSCSTWSSNM